MLANREGFTVADASNLFEEELQAARAHRVWLQHAWPTVLRQSAADAGDAHAQRCPIAAYNKLYEVEAKIRNLSDDERLAVRRAESQPVWDELCAWCETYQPHEPPSSKLGEAIRYFINNRKALGRFLENGLIAPIDNGDRRASAR